MSRVIIVLMEEATEGCLKGDTCSGQEVWCMFREYSYVLLR